MLFFLAFIKSKGLYSFQYQNKDLINLFIPRAEQREQQLLQLCTDLDVPVDKLNIRSQITLNIHFINIYVCVYKQNFSIETILAM